MSVEANVEFLHWILGRDEGYLAIGAKVARTKDFKEVIFRYPGDFEAVNSFIERERIRSDLYFCPTILRRPKRKKYNIESSCVVWADLDFCTPNKLLVPPSCVLETSKNRYQAYWVLDGPNPSLDAEEINRRIAYYHKIDGCDQTGWDLTQYLRIPGTKNFKRPPDISEVKVVDVDINRIYTIKDFESHYPQIASLPSVIDLEMPTIPEGVTADSIIQSVRLQLNPRFWELYEQEPFGTWSDSLWELEQILFGLGLTEEDVFIIARESALNKYKRDNRPDDHLWKEVVKSKAHYDGVRLTPNADPNDDETDDVLGEDGFEDNGIHVPRKNLLTDEERYRCGKRATIVEEYIEWAKTATDAAPQYHEAGIFTILSSLLAGRIYLKASFGRIVPNLWFMITGDTTLARKSTAMDMAVDIVLDIDEEAMLATDGSIEGMMSAIAGRPAIPSVFLRDEFSGFLEAMAKRDYYAGMMETLTKLYDGKTQKRVLRKETIFVKNPVLIMLTGGIRDRILHWISSEHITSGFIPRFCFIDAKTDIRNTRPLSLESQDNYAERSRIVSRLRDVYLHYSAVQEFDISANGHEELLHLNKSWAVTLTDDALARYNRLAYAMQSMGDESDARDLVLPMMHRLSISGLKAAMLIAAAERLDDGIVVHESDIIHAFYYVEKWVDYAIEVVANADKTIEEKQLERIYKYVRNTPGVMQASLMRRFRLNSKDFINVLTTLEQRGLVNSEKKGHGRILTAVTKINRGQ